MAIPKKVLTYLTKQNYRYDVIEHRTTYTAWDTAQTEQVPPRAIVKALVVAIGKMHVLALVPADRRLAIPKLIALVKKNVPQGTKLPRTAALAREAWMKKNIPGALGATPPFAALVRIPVYMDALLAKNAKIYVGSGSYVHAVRIATAQYRKKENTCIGAISMKK